MAKLPVTPIQDFFCVCVPFQVVELLEDWQMCFSTNLIVDLKVIVAVTVTLSKLIYFLFKQEKHVLSESTWFNL